MDIKIGFVATAAALAVAFATGIAVGQETAPTQNKGLSVGAPTTIDLAQEVDGVAGRQLRVRVVTVEPGGTVAIHNHKDRPAVAHLIQGTLTEKREGGFVREHHTGDTWTETKEVTHWAENHGDDKAVLVVADIFKP